MGILGRDSYFGKVSIVALKQFHFLTRRSAGFLLLDVVIGIVVMGLLVHSLTMSIQFMIKQSSELNQNYQQMIMEINQVMRQFESGDHNIDDFRLCVHDVSGQSFYFICLK